MTVVNLRDYPGKGYAKTLPDDVVRVDRPTRWGNPFKAGDPDPAWCNHMSQWSLFGGWVRHPLDRAGAIYHYRLWLLQELKRDPDFLEPLRGKDLGCWCRPLLACHADVIEEMLR
jgi:hypothetical protein